MKLLKLACQAATKRIQRDGRILDKNGENGPASLAAMANLGAERDHCCLAQIQGHNLIDAHTLPPALPLCGPHSNSRPIQ